MNKKPIMDTTTSGVEPPVAITTNKQVPSTSSIDTAIFGQNDGGSDYGKLQPIVSHQSLDTAITGSDTTQIPQSMQLISRPSSVTFEEQTPILEDSAQQRVQVSPPIGASLHSVVPNNNTVPEFLYQLTKMLTDNNRDIIEWSNGKIEVHNPHKLQTNVLNRYFRHSKFASFQRQLNYFGFRKLAGKGKMAPCSYVNDATTKELGSLLTIKRKVGNEPKVKSSKKRDREDSTTSLDGDGDGVDASQKPCVNPILANILYRSSTNEPSLGVQVNTSIQNNVHNPINRSQQEIARVAVGRGIRHSFSHPLAKKPAPLPSRSTPLDQGESCGESGQPTDTTEVVQASLSALKNNFENSMEAAIGDKASLNDDSGDDSYPRSSYVPGSMRRDDSLVDLAMIPYADDENQSDYNLQSSGLTFIDFPWQDPSMFSDG